jgi:signal transduction histidine kinase
MTGPIKQDRRKSKIELLEELDALRREMTRLQNLADVHRAAQERLEQLATFPEENPNPVIEMNFAGQTIYLNPVAQIQFPELWQLGGAHPLMQDLRFPFAARPGETRSHVVREIQIGESVYEQKVCYMDEAHHGHIRIYVHDITRRKRAEETNQELIKRLVHAHEEERQRVSRELHDEAGQALTALKLSLELIQREIPPSVGSARRDLTEAIHLTEATKEQIRMLARGLRPPALDAVGLNLTLESFCRDFSKRTQLSIDYHGTDVSDLPDMANMSFYRTLQEALANVVRHAGATHVDVHLVREADRVRLIVEDNGTGLGLGRKPSLSKRSGGIGLLGMQERLALLGGGLDIEKGTAGGVRLSAYLPAREAA